MESHSLNGAEKRKENEEKEEYIHTTEQHVQCVRIQYSTIKEKKKVLYSTQYSISVGMDGVKKWVRKISLLGVCLYVRVL